MEQKRILVVDDERDLCDILLFNLHAAGYQAEAVCSADEALKDNTTLTEITIPVSRQKADDEIIPTE